MDECRKEFEAAIRADACMADSPLDWHPLGGYLDDVIQNMFVGFQLAYNRRAPVAQLSDEEIIAIRKATRTMDFETPFSDSIAFARAIAARVQPAGQQSEGWICTGCGQNVPPVDVTFQEYHDTRHGGCGCKVVPNMRPPAANAAQGVRNLTLRDDVLVTSEDRSGLRAMLGLTMRSVVAGDAELVFTSECGRVFKFYHTQDCCENVFIESVVGDLNDLVGERLLLAEEVSNVADPGKRDSWDESYTWTFYKFATRKGYVDVRWYGTSNGYYSESVDFCEVDV